MAATTKGKESVPISMQMILDSIDDEDAQNAKEIDFKDYNPDSARSLSLSFKGIAKIENLLFLRNLTRLRLDNNQITVIEGIEHLHHLTWLDLSFNKITSITGLATLSKLTDLSLFNNRLHSIEGIQDLREMQCLSLGNNLIRATAEIYTLEALPKLQVLNLEGNPFTKDLGDKCKTYVLKILPRLRYLDYALVLPSDVRAAKEQLEAEGRSRTQDSKTDETLEEDGLRHEPVTRPSTSRVANLTSDLKANLLSWLYDDPDVHKLVELGITEVRITAQGVFEAFQSTLDDCLAKAQYLNDKLAMEEENFSRGYKEMTSPQLEITRKAVAGWEAKFSKLMRLALSETNERDDEIFLGIEKLRVEAEEIVNAQIKNEVLLHKQASSIIDKFESAVLEIKAQMLLNHENLYRRLEQAHLTGWAKLAESVESRLTAASGTDAINGATDFPHLDRDAVLAALNTAKEGVISRISKKEMEGKQLETARLGAVIHNAGEAELRRDRDELAGLRQWLSAKADCLTDLGLKLTADHNDEDND